VQPVRRPGAGTEAEIAEFCSETYKVKFPMFSKVEVNGENAAPLYKHLTALETQPKGKRRHQVELREIRDWQDGEVVARFPADFARFQEVMAVLEAELAKK
jgi:glutathione peroxidase